MMPIRLIVRPAPRLRLHVQRAKLVYAGGQPYTGAYQVTPKTYEHTVLETRDRLLTDNIQIAPVPQYAVSNSAGGETFIIGEEYFQHGN